MKEFNKYIKQYYPSDGNTNVAAIGSNLFLRETIINESKYYKIITNYSIIRQGGAAEILAFLQSIQGKKLLSKPKIYYKDQTHINVKTKKTRFYYVK